MNLAVNARDAMPQGGRLCISVKSRDLLVPEAAQGGTITPGAWAVLGGAFVFAMDLNLLAMGAPKWVAALAPAGGTAMMFGWLWLAVIAFAGDALNRFES